MSRLLVEWKVRGLRAQIGERMRSGAPVVALLRCAVAELEAQTRLPDMDFLRERLLAMLEDWRFSLLLRANPWLILQKGFFRHSADVVAPHLLSKVIVTTDGRAGRIAEVAAVAGDDDARLPPSPRHAGRLQLSGDAWRCCASISCVCDSRASSVLIRAIEPLEGRALMQAQAGTHPDADGFFRGAEVVSALGLKPRHQGSDVTRRRSAVRIAWDLQPPPLVLGEARGSRQRRGGRIWSWGLPRR